MKMNDKPRKLSKKIMLLIIVVNLSICTVGSLVLYKYFSEILIRQMWKDSQVNFERAVLQYDSVFEEIERYAAQISIETIIQNYLAAEAYDSVVEENKVRREILTELQRLRMLSDSIESIALEKQGEVKLWTHVPFVDENSNALVQQWYEAYCQTPVSASKGKLVSEPYTFAYQGNSGENRLEYISICAPVYSVNQERRPVGNLIINIELSTLDDILEVNKDGFDGIGYFCGGRQSIVLANDSVTENDVLLAASDSVKEDKQFPVYLSKDSTLGLKLAAVCQFSGVSMLFNEDVIVLLLIVVFDLLISAAILIPVMLKVTRPAKVLASAMEQAGKGDLKTRVSITSKDEFQTLGEELNKMIARLDDYMQAAIANEKIRHELEYEVLVAQINPHFIYNTLNTIVYLAKKGRNTDVVNITHAFIELLQDGLKMSSDNNMFSSIKEELSIIRNYVCIQNYRYKDCFEVIYECSQDLLDIKVPTSVIQPLVENALFHGIVPLGRPGKIWLKIEKKNIEGKACLKILVEDEGVGISPERLDAIQKGTLALEDVSRNHVGIANVQKRLAMLYDEKSTMSIMLRKEGGTVVEIVIPMNKK